MNYLRNGTRNHQRSRWTRFWYRSGRFFRSRRFLFPLITILVAAGLMIGVFWAPAQAVYQNARAGKDSLDFARVQIQNEQFVQASQSLNAARGYFSIAQDRTQGLHSLRLIPYFRTQIDAVTSLLSAARESSTALGRVSEFASRLFSVIQSDASAEVRLVDISEEQKVAILDEMTNALPLLREVQRELDRTVELIEGIPQRGVAGPIRRIVDPLREELPQVQKAFADLVPLVQTLPQLSGHPEPQTYLFLLQNNAELRPTGGFIGTYGVLMVAGGEIEEFTTDNVYNLDEPAKGYLFVEPPQPLQKYLRQEQWFFRDSNWSPDFPTAAAQALEFYRMENGAHADAIDGVIAVTPTFIERLLTLTGPIDIEGVIFDETNVVDTLQFQVTQGFYRQGIPASERKEIIGQLADRLLDALLALPRSQWSDLLATLQENLDEKHILAFFSDREVQRTVAGQDWSGSVLPGEGDFLMWIDANLASLKSDPGILRTLSYTVVEQPDGSFLASSAMNYDNTGKLDWKTTRYRTYARAYAPLGATLLDSAGAMDNDKLQSSRPGTVEVRDELGTTRFGAFIATELQETNTLSLTYTLPATVTDHVRSTGAYTLRMQKQPGTIGHRVDLQFSFARRVQFVDGVEGDVQIDGSSVTITTDLREDRTISIFFERP